VVRIVPPEWAGFLKYVNNNPTEGRGPKMSILKFVLHSIVDQISSGVFIPVLTLFGFKQIVTVVIFIAVGFDIFIRHEISTQVVVLIGIGTIALYLESLVENAKHIKLFGGFLEWQRKD
jgi:hypothetical protein